MIWHYTHEQAFEGILSNGSIRPAQAHMDRMERPITWFSKEQFWEPTVTKGERQPNGVVKDLGMTDLLQRNIRLFRIGVDDITAPFRWRDLKVRSGMAPTIASGLAEVAKALGANPSRWRGTFQSVPSERWLAVEVFVCTDWIPFRPVAK